MGTRLGGGYGRASDRAITIVMVALMVLTLAALALTGQPGVDQPPTTPDIMEDTRP